MPALRLILRRPILRWPLLALLIGLVTLAVTAATGGLSASLIEPDEGGHYVNALFLGDWLRAGLPSPMPFARDFYAHFPRLSIGHWPPGWYMAEAPFFALVRPSPYAAAVASAVIAGLPGIVPIWALSRLGRPRLGIALALTYAILPLTLESARYIWVDQPLALTIALAAIAWHAASDRPSWPRMLVFAVLAAACPLVKGNGALIALVPAVDIALTRRWRLLRAPALWGAALLTVLIVAPWYWLSFKISAEGFNYAPGAAYAWLALRTNAATLVANIGWAGLGLAAIGLANPPGERCRLAALAAAVVLATLVFQSAVPASLAPRYLAPLMPWVLALIGLGITRLSQRGGRAQVVAAVVAILALLPALVAIASLRPKPDLGASAIAAMMSRAGGVWLVDGRSGGEGAVIAAAAYADAGRRHLWVARASQWLSSSDFMGRGYRLSVRDPRQTRAVLDRLGASGAVSVTVDHRLAYPHSRLLIEAVCAPTYALVVQAFRRGSGTVTIARRRSPVMPNAALLTADPLSGKADRMTKALE